MRKFLAGLLCGVVLGVVIVSVLRTNESRLAIAPSTCDERKIIVEEVVEKSTCEDVDNSLEVAKIEKAFLLFLASIGIKKDYAESIKSIVNNPEGFAPDNRLENKPQESVAKAQTQFYYPRNQAIKKFDIQVSIDELEDYDPSLKNNLNYLLQDSAVYFAKSKTISGFKEVKKFNGLYTGKLYRLTGKHKGKIEDIEMSIEYWQKGKSEIDGNFTMTIARDSIIYSNSRGEGGNNQLYLNPQNPEQLIIKAAPGMYFHFINKDLTHANVYDEGEFIGVSTLKKL